MQSQYNIANHTILPLIYRILGPFDHICTLISYNFISIFVKGTYNAIIIYVQSSHKSL
jgi:hypothetical protein